jgi:hypothetical protein
MATSNSGGWVYNPLDEATARQGIVGGRIKSIGLSPVGLEVEVATGNVIEVSGELVSIADGSGTPLLTFDPLTQHTILATGLDSTVLPSDLTLYHVYLSNSSASYAPSSLRLSLVAPTYLSGSPYLGTTGNAANWRYLGSVYQSSAGFYADTTSQRDVANLYNGVAKPLRACPGYTDDNAQTTYSLTKASWATMNAGADDFVTFVDLGEVALAIPHPSPYFTLSVTCSLVGAGVARFGLAIDSTVDPLATCTLPAAGANVSTSCGLSYDVAAVTVPARRQVNMIAMTSNVATAIVADLARTGAAADPPATQLTGFVWC